MKKFFTYGIYGIGKKKFDDRFRYDPLKRKITGGLWACNYHEAYYSDWVVVTMLFPFLYGNNKMAKGTLFTIKEDARILEITENNYTTYIKDGKLDLEKLLQYDAILYTENLVTTVKFFEAYYVESLQIFDIDIIANKKDINLEIDFVREKITKERGKELNTRIIDIVDSSEVVKVLKDGI